MRDNIIKKFSDIFLVISPPRCCSTVFARVFWQSPQIKFYSHEPFETHYYENKPINVALKNILEAIDISLMTLGNKVSPGLVIKEMPYQVGDNFPILANLTSKPIVFLIRDPRLSIESRMKKKVEVGDNPLFPFIETGWELLDSQIGWCKKNGHPYLIVDATDFREHPDIVFPPIFSQLGLIFDISYLKWNKADGVRLDNLNGKHTHLYTRVLTSTGLEPPEEQIPSLNDFPEKSGFRSHVNYCMSIYHKLKSTKYV